MTGTYDGEKWKRVREAALARDRVCQDCGAGDVLHVHHITPVCEFDSPTDAHTLNNVAVLCERCHPKWEGRNQAPNLLDEGGKVHLSQVVYELSANTIAQQYESPCAWLLYELYKQRVKENAHRCDFCFRSLTKSRRETDHCDHCGHPPKLWLAYRNSFPDADAIARRADRLSDVLDKIGFPVDASSMRSAAQKKWADDEWHGELKRVTDIIAYVGIHRGYDPEAVELGYEPFCPQPTPLPT